MVCPKCGAQLLDGTQFCSECGSPTMEQSAPMAQPSQPIPQPTQPIPQPTQPIPQPTQSFGTPVQPTYQQPQQFDPQQPGYADPAYGQMTAVKKKVPVVPIVIGVCSAALVAFLIVLFTVIIPNNSGIKGKLRHKWTASEGGISVTYDFKKNEVQTFGMSFPIKWDVSGDDHLTVSMTFMGETSSDDYIFSLSSDGRTLTLADADYPSSKTTWTRAD